MLKLTLLNLHWIVLFSFLLYLVGWGAGTSKYNFFKSKKATIHQKRMETMYNIIGYLFLSNLYIEGYYSFDFILFIHILECLLLTDCFIYLVPYLKVIKNTECQFDIIVEL